MRTATANDLLDRPPPKEHRFTVDDYYAMVPAGIIAARDRIELIDGKILDMAPIGMGHSGTTMHLTTRSAKLLVAGDVLVSVQGPLRLDNYSDPQPDLMLLRLRADGYRRSHPGPADVLLLIEVAESSLAYDRGPKLALYARHAVPEVWIVDLAGRVLEVCNEPADDGYRSRTRLTEGQAAARLVPDFTVDLAASFG